MFPASYTIEIPRKCFGKTCQYNLASQITNILHQLTATGSQINKADYVHNPMGNRTSLTDRRETQTFGYDQLDRLISASHPLLLDPQAFAYDAVGNRTTGGSVVNPGNQLTADTNHTYQYDDNGNLTRKTLLATGNYTQYSYDAENRLTKVEEFASGNPTAITTSSYRYDGLGRRIEKVANGQTTRYIYDGEDILLEYNGSNVLQARYTHGPGIDEPLSRTPMVPGLGSGQTAVLASTPDGLRGPVVDDGIKVNGQVSVGFVFVSGMPAPAIGQPIDSTGLEQPIAPIDVTAAAATGTLAVDLIDTGGIGGNAPLYLVTRDQATNQVIESRLLFPARATFASTTPLGTPLVVASATVPTTTPVADGTLYYHQDGLGTVTELTDINGAVAKAYAYDAYGNILESPGTVDQPYTYTGREYDSESGLYYYRARYYDPGTGRLLQKDPIGSFLRDVNLYAYVTANPVNGVDPLGLFNPVKGASALLNASIAGVSAASGAAKILIAAGISPAATTGVGALPPTALYLWGTWNVKSAKAAAERALQQWQEAICEDWSQAAWKNLYGALPGGTHYDDPDEANGPWDYIKSQGWWRFFSDLGYF
ncbi:MAG TPA: RHS repeat-associated core domain-containing protein [Nitrospira sp.]|nr:RHS repeat-associated core domain-containing protein [Nitrospira sp.]